MDTEERLADLLDSAEVVTINIINTKKGHKAGGDQIQLLSGIPEYANIISKLRSALCK